MNIRKRSSMWDANSVTILFMLCVWLFMISSWIVNIYELTKCDFESPYKCEIVHGIGIPFPPVSWLGAWADFGK